MRRWGPKAIDATSWETQPARWGGWSSVEVFDGTDVWVGVSVTCVTDGVTAAEWAFLCLAHSMANAGRHGRIGHYK
jgi:hypothetical protein